ncbi:MAG: stalk domain-containing protein, partial [Caldisericia bacterium]|nr:stalk domain-containing protein [Caldisericia bacterium]
TTKEAYLEKPDQFYFPIRAKIANNHIYVSDFGNCRYHVIPIEPLTIDWKEDRIHKDNISIFSSESGSLHYDISAPSILSYQVSSTVPWLTPQQQNGTLADKRIDYQILGEKLTPWQTHQGEIQITFPEQWSFLNHTIPVSVYAIGSTVELTIGSIQAKVDGKWISMELGYIPVLKQGRTCIGLRFLTEYLFRSHATIEYEANIQRIKVTTREHTVYMIINHDIASVDGKSVTLDVPPFIQQGRTMIPLRFVSESLEAEVSWDGKLQKVQISYPKK